MKKLMMMCVAMGMAACGSAGAANVSACKSMVQKLKCGSAPNPLSDSVCDSYQNTLCDISEYFKCMEAAYVCTNGSYDSGKLANATSCTSKAVCR